ncbi:PorP/SprF family type IX secretion system membrane protein [Chitinophaga horti]|uniref:PorP/SprF family type IX secretion system membrane protein n=1 Tax=Chitinophaga horti TaxID=2920382 RepID=A0ABY6J5F5_9BACT|nr:PorP/SprF family type IX secretion system membrane protein [Chitinophaga horti]UYQ94898.1 PorP/SprF family type IX secretion system membrane protein [Chitinophaga horti]
MKFPLLTKTALSAATLLLLQTGIKAQELGNETQVQHPLAAQYFMNQYLANPAMAGLGKGLKLDFAHRRMWQEIDGGPVTTSVTANIPVTSRVAAGAQVYSDKAGLLGQTRIAVTYAYHLPLNLEKETALHFGLSGVLDNKRISYKGMQGDPNDPAVARYNARDNFFDADFGMAYTNHNMTLQASVPSLFAKFTKDEYEAFDRALFFAAASYKVETHDGTISYIEPKICVRGIKGESSLIDIGANLAVLDEFANLFAMYHSTRNFSAGLGFNFKSNAGLQLIYNSQTAGLKNYTSGAFEINLHLNLFRKLVPQTEQ